MKLVSNKLKILGENPPFPHLAIGLQTGGLQDGDLELLHGPVNLVCIYKRLIVEDVHTGRLVTYTAADHHEEAIYSCSYIQILTEIAILLIHQPLVELKCVSPTRLLEVFANLCYWRYINRTLSQEYGGCPLTVHVRKQLQKLSFRSHHYPLH